MCAILTALLREGVIYSLEKNFQVSDIRTRTALGLAEQFNLDLAQADRVANSAKTLIDQYTHWQKPHLADEMKNLLIWAARLLEVGHCNQSSQCAKTFRLYSAKYGITGF